MGRAGLETRNDVLLNLIGDRHVERHVVDDEVKLNYREAIRIRLIPNDVNHRSMRESV